MTARSLPRPGVVLGIAVLFVGLVLVGAAPAVAAEMSPTHADMPMDSGHMHGPSGPFVWWMPFVMPVVWLGLLAGAVYLLYRIVGGAASTDSAMDDLDRAYARGEISDEEYESRRERLEV